MESTEALAFINRGIIKMMHSLTIDKVEPIYIQAQNETVQDVHISISEGKRVVAKRRLSFPLSYTEKEIRTALEKYVKTFEADVALATADKKRAQVEQQAAEVADKLTGETINAS